MTDGGVGRAGGRPRHSILRPKEHSDMQGLPAITSSPRSELTSRFHGAIEGLWSPGSTTKSAPSRVRVAVRLAGRLELLSTFCALSRTASPPRPGRPSATWKLAEASFGDIADTLAKALDLLADCQRAYLAAPGHLRRQWNQALFERLVVYDERIADAEVAEPFATLADPGLPDRLDGEAVTGTGASSGGGSNEELLIGAPGFEPGTSPTRTVRATRLRHAPRGVIIPDAGVAALNGRCRYFGPGGCS